MRERRDGCGEVYIEARERERERESEEARDKGEARVKVKVLRGEAFRCASVRVQDGRKWKRAEW